MTDSGKINTEPTQEGRYELPEGWAWTTIAKLGERRGGGTPSRKKPEYFQGGIPWLTVADLPDISHGPSFLKSSREAITREALDESSAKIIPPGSVIFATRVSVGKVGIAGTAVATNQDFRSLLPGPAHEPKYIASYLSHVAIYSLPRTRGTTIDGITAGAFDGLEVPLPPLAEQQRIVAKIGALFEQRRTARQTLDRIPRLLKKFRQSVLAAAFRGDLTRDWREQHPDVEPASALLERIRAGRRRKWGEDLRAKGKESRKITYTQPDPIDLSDLPEIPKGWVWTNIDTLISDARYGTSQKCTERPSGVAVLRIPNVVKGRIDLSDLKFAHLSHEELTRLSVEPSDLLVVRTNGSLDLVGRAALVSEALKPCAFASYLIRLRPVLNSTLAQYIHFAFSSDLARGPIEAKARSTAGQFNVNLETLRSIRLPLPPIDEMKDLVERVAALWDRATSIEKVIEIARRRADKLDQSILARAFRGELVPQDPNDEPASALLDRIRAKQELNAGSRNTYDSRSRGEGNEG